MAFSHVKSPWFNPKTNFVQLDAPIQAKKAKFAEQQKLKQLVSKNVNRNVEQEIRQRASEGHLNLSKAQQAVAKHHQEVAPSTSSNQ